METNTFVIGATDDFESIEALIDYIDNQDFGEGRSYAAFEFDVHDGCDPDTITMIGRGYAFSNNWSIDDTYSFVIRGKLDITELKAQEATNRRRNWDPNDPTNW